MLLCVLCLFEEHFSVSKYMLQIFYFFIPRLFGRFVMHSLYSEIGIIFHVKHPSLVYCRMELRPSQLLVTRSAMTAVSVLV